MTLSNYAEGAPSPLGTGDGSTQQGPSYPLTAYARATVTIGGAEGLYTYDPCAGTHGSSCPVSIPDVGTVSITIEGNTISTTYGQPSTGASVATYLAWAVNSTGLGVEATVSGSTITLKCNYPGAECNGDFPFTVSSATTQTQYFTNPSFTLTASGGTLTGGTNVGPTTYDAGTITATVNNITASVNYSGSATPQSIASQLALAIQAAAGSTVTVKSDGDVNILVSTGTGLGADYQVTGKWPAHQPRRIAMPLEKLCPFIAVFSMSGRTSAPGLDSRTRDP